MEKEDVHNDAWQLPAAPVALSVVHMSGQTIDSAHDHLLTWPGGLPGCEAGLAWAGHVLPMTGPFEVLTMGRIGVDIHQGPAGGLALDGGALRHGRIAEFAPTTRKRAATLAGGDGRSLLYPADGDVSRTVGTVVGLL